MLGIRGLRGVECICHDGRARDAVGEVCSKWGDVQWVFGGVGVWGSGVGMPWE